MDLPVWVSRNFLKARKSRERFLRPSSSKGESGKTAGKVKVFISLLLLPDKGQEHRVREAALTHRQGLIAAAGLLFLAIAQAESHYPIDLLSWIA